MNKNNLKILVRDLEFLLGQLKAEVYADAASYIDKDDARRVTIEDDDGETD